MVLGKKPPLLVTIGTALLLIGGGTLAYGIFQWRLAKARGLPAGARAVPDEAVAVVSLTTNGEQWQRLRQFGTPETQTAFDQRLADWRDRWLTRYGLSFSQDLQPWVGPEVTLVWLPEPAIGSDSGTSQVVVGNQRRVLLIPIADPEAAQVSAAAFPIGDAAEKSVEYRGVTLWAIAPTEGETTEALWVGLLGTHLILVAEDETTAQRVIDTYKGGKSIADLPGYRRSFEPVAMPQAFSKLYLNAPAAVQILAQTSQPPLPDSLVQTFQESRGIAAAAALTSQGVQIKSTSWLASSSDRTYANTNVTAQLPEYLPQDTLVMVSGGNFQQFWIDLREHRNWGGLTALNPDNLALALQGSTGLTLEEDLLPWMAGEFALALVPQQDKPEAAEGPPLPNPNLVTLVQVSDRPKAEQAFSRLDDVVKNRYRFSLVNEPVGDVELVKWISPFEAVTLARGWLDGNTAFFTVGTATETAIVPKPRRSLATAPLFQLTTGDAPYPNNGYFYLNLEALSRTHDNLFVPTVPVETQGALRAIQALGVTATVLDDQRLRYDLYVALKRGNRPGPLPSTEVAPEEVPAAAPEETPEAVPEETPPSLEEPEDEDRGSEE